MICAHEGIPEHDQLFGADPEPGDSLDARDRIAARQQWWADFLAARAVLRQVETQARAELEW